MPTNSTTSIFQPWNPPKFNWCLKFLAMVLGFSCIALFVATPLNYWQNGPRSIFGFDVGANKMEPYRNPYFEQCRMYESSNKNCSRWNRSHSANGTWHRPAFDSHEFIDLKQVLLVIYFNDPHYDAAAKTYAIYNSVFAEIMFCGPEPNADDFWPLWQSTRDKNSYVSLPPHVRYVSHPPKWLDSGHFSYMCFQSALEVLRTNYETARFTGILLMADDVVLNPWVWPSQQLTLDKSWSLKQTTAEDRYIFQADSGCRCRGTTGNNADDCDSTITWPYAKWQLNYTTSFFDELETLASSDALWKEGLQRLQQQTFGPRRMMGIGGEIVYVAKRHWEAVEPAINLCKRHELWFEMVWPTVLTMTVPPKEQCSLSLRGMDFWDGFIRFHPIVDVYSSQLETIHPVKFSRVFKHLYSNNLSLNISALKEQSQNAGRHLEQDLSLDCFFCHLIQVMKAYGNFLSQQRRAKLRLSRALIYSEVKRQRQLLIAGYWRSGASILGELFNRKGPETFYMFEPLNGFTNPDRQLVLSNKQLAQTLKLVYDCRFELFPHESLLHNKTMRMSRDTVKFLNCFYGVGQKSLSNCFPQLVEPCKAADTLAVKEVFARYQTIAQLLRDLPELHVVHIIRDPRSLILSRRDNKIASDRNETLYETARHLCSMMVDDLRGLHNLPAEFRRRIMTIFYEDVATKPKDTFHKILNFIGLDEEVDNRKKKRQANDDGRLTVSVNLELDDEWLKFDTNLTAAASKWRLTLKPEEIREIDRACRDVGFYSFFYERHRQQQQQQQRKRMM